VQQESKAFKELQLKQLQLFQQQQSNFQLQLQQQQLDFQSLLQSQLQAQQLAHQESLKAFQTSVDARFFALLDRLAMSPHRLPVPAPLDIYMQQDGTQHPATPQTQHPAPPSTVPLHAPSPIQITQRQAGPNGAVLQSWHSGGALSVGAVHVTMPPGAIPAPTSQSFSSATPSTGHVSRPQ
jgi:hypothetical protein